MGHFMSNNFTKRKGKLFDNSNLKFFGTLKVEYRFLIVSFLFFQFLSIVIVSY